MAYTPLQARESVWKLNKGEQQAYHYIMSLQMEKALPLLHANTPASAYLRNLKESVTLIITEDPALVDNYEDHFEERLEFISTCESKSPYKKFFMAELRLQSALVNLKIGNEWSAAWDFRCAYKLIRANTLEFPKFLPNYKSKGLLQVMLGSVPQKYQWWMSLLGMEGSISAGLSDLQKVANSRHMFSLEAQVIYHLLQAYLLNRSETAVQSFKGIYETNSGNKLLGYLYISLLVKNAQSADALEVFKHVSTLKDSYLEFNFLRYVVAEIYLQKGDYPLAENYLSTFINNARGRNFIKDAWYKLFLAHWLQGHETKALAMHRKALSAGQEIVEADKHAAKSLRQRHFPNKMIMKIRLATDGGFYKAAENIIAQHPDPIFNSRKEKIEFIYRKARLFHKTGNAADAMKLYLETITSSAGENWYFAPNSCLQLGYIYHKKEDTTRAKYYYKKVLTYKTHEYKTSLDNKAKAALVRMGVQEN